MIVLTGGMSDGARRLALEMGARRFVSKSCRVCGAPLKLAVIKDTD